MRLITRRWFMVGVCSLALPGFAAQPERPALIVFAAASLTNVLQELGDGFTRQSALPVKFSFAASSALAKQIEGGAPADVFFSADVEWMDYLQGHHLIREASRTNRVANQLVLIAPVDSRVELKIEPHFPLAATLGAGRLTTGDPDSVPVGRYAREALTKLGVWNEVETRLVRADNVRSALAFVDRGEASLGIVYATDAAIDKKVRSVAVFPEDTHLPIVYPIALTTNATPDARQFVEYVESPAADAIFEKYGFKPLHP